jgi:nucleotide-binding universal stress UspA family protein
MVLVRPELADESEIRPLRKLLLPLDGSPTTARALRTATQLAEELGASIDLLYVANSSQAAHEPGGMAAPRYVDQPQHEWPHWGQEVIDRLLRCLARCPESVPVDIFLTDGDPGPEIARFAARHEEDGIVLVRRSQLEPGRGKILRHLFAQTPIPVIFVISQHPRYVLQPVAPS